MDYTEAKELIDQTYVLTEKEKTILLKKFRMGDQKIIQMLVDFNINRNVQSFYTQLRNENMLATQEIYKEFMENCSPKSMAKSRMGSAVSMKMSHNEHEAMSQSPRKADTYYHNLAEILSYVPLHNIDIVSLLRGYCGKIELNLNSTHYFF